MRVRGIDLYVEEWGAGPPIVLSHGLLWSARMFEPQMRGLSRSHRCIAYDHRGQGRSQIVGDPVVDIETVYEDAVALLEALDLGPCCFVGLSMGGFVGLRLAARRPDLLRSLVLVDTAADAEPRKNLPKYRALSLIVRAGGMPLVRAPVAKVMFGSTFLRDPARKRERDAAIAQLMMNPPSIVRAVEGVLTREPVTHELAAIDVPTLVLHGEEDRAIAMRRAEAMAAGIRGARLQGIPRAGHTSTLENPDAVTSAIEAFARP